MPKVETKKHDLQPGKDEDMIIKVGTFRLYFQNYYTIISLANDIATGGLYLAGSLTQTFTSQQRVGMYLYIFASFFLLMRPIIRIVHNVYLYKENQYRKEVLGEKLDDGYYDDSEENGMDPEDQKETEDNTDKETGHTEKRDEEEKKADREEADKEIEILPDDDEKESNHQEKTEKN